MQITELSVEAFNRIVPMRFLLCFSLIATVVFMQFNAQAQEFELESEFVVVKGDTVIYNPDSSPAFPGGDEALQQHFKKHLPKLKYTGKVQSSDVWITVLVRKDGSIGASNIIANSQRDLDATLINAIKSLPPYKPAVKDGKPVATIEEITFDY